MLKLKPKKNYYFILYATVITGFSNYARAFEIPQTLIAGAASISRFIEPKVVGSNVTVSVWVPHPRNTNDVLLNSNALSFPSEMPQVFVIGDGSIKRAFMLVDYRPESTLYKRIQTIAQNIKKSSPKDLEGGVVRAASSMIAWTDGSKFNDGRAEFPWDIAITRTKDASEVIARAGYSNVFDYPIPSQTQMPVVTFEKYMDAKKGYCIQKALLASLLLSALNISHRFINGEVITGLAVGSGHAWIELTDGRILDAAWDFLGKRTPSKDVNHPTWYVIKNYPRLEYENSLILDISK